MSTIESLAIVQAQETRDSELSAMSREELEAEIERLRQREKLSIATEEIAQIGHYEWNFELDRLESCSEEYARILDTTVDETLKHQATMNEFVPLIHPDDREHYLQETERFSETLRFDVKFRLVLGENNVKHVREISAAMLDDTGAPMRTFGILQDLSRQVEHERELEYRDELARHAESITDIGHFIYDEENQRYLYISDGFARIYGAAVEDYLTKMTTFEDDLSDIVEEDRDRVAEEYRHFRETGHDCALEYRVQRNDGSVRWIRELGTAKQMKDGKVTKTLGVVQDITERVKHEQELTFRSALAYQAEALTDIGYFLFDEKKDRHIFASLGQARILGVDVAQFSSMSNAEYIEAFLYEEDRDHVTRTYERVLAEHSDWKVEYRIKRPNGELRWIHEVGRAHKVTSEGVEQTIGVLQDITEQKNNEQEMQYKDALATQAEAITEIGHFYYDEIRQQYLFVSPGFARIIGKPVEALVGISQESWGTLYQIHPEDKPGVQEAYDRFLRDGDVWQVDFRVVRDDGEIRWVRERGETHLFSHGIPEHTVGVLQDITAEKNAEQEILKVKENLEQQVIARTRELANTVKQLQEEVQEREKIAAELDFLANHDALTGLPSLRLCKDRLEHSLAEARRNRQMSAVMFLDLDGFKQINDSHGHEFGDMVLKATAERIKGEVRETDTVARIGGDEFVIILSSLPQVKIAERIASSIINQVSQTLEIDGISVKVGASIGISLYPEDGITPEEMIREADRAMYRIKEQGKNSYGFAHNIGL